MPERPLLLGSSEYDPPEVFAAWEDHAAYADGSLTRSQAITLARDECWQLTENYKRAELRAVRVFMCPIEGAEADELFGGEFERGWIEVTPTNAAQRAKLIRMWKVEPR